jgi:protein gp37
MGTSVENADYTWRVRELVRVPAKVRFLSVEPLLGPINLREVQIGTYRYDMLAGERRGTITRDIIPCHALDWVIVGGESGGGRRQCEIDWIASLVKQCKDTGVPIWVKQDSAYRPGQQGRIPDDLFIQQEPSRARFR